MKKIIVFGGTGFIGQNLIPFLKSNGYYIINISRNSENSKQVLPAADEHINLNISEDQLISVIDKSFAVINLAGASLADGYWTSKRKKILYNSRIKVTSDITNAIKLVENPPGVYISSSAVGYYNDEGEKIITENSGNGSGFLSKLCYDWEKESLKAEAITRVVNPRTGLALGINGGALKSLILPYKFLIGGPLGSGKQWMPWIHIKDLCKLFLFILENDKIRGPINITSPNPVTMYEFARILSKVMKKPAFFRVPSILLKLLLGEKSVIVLEGQRAIPEKAIQSSYKFDFPELGTAIKNLLGIM